MRKVIYLFKEIFHLVRKHKLYFIAPILFVLALLAFLVFYIGPAAVVSFIYAGI